jgi:hypothetical protein
MIILIIISSILIAIAAMSEAIMDNLQFHYFKSIFKDREAQQFWNPLISWSNKYKNGDKNQGEKFICSTTLFVGLTDAWHLFKLINHTCLFIGLSVLAFQLDSVKELIVVTCIARMIYGFVFTIFFDSILNKDS